MTVGYYGRLSNDRLDVQQSGVSLRLFRWADLVPDDVTRLESSPKNLSLGYINVLSARSVWLPSQEPPPFRQDFQHTRIGRGMIVVKQCIEIT